MFKNIRDYFYTVKVLKLIQARVHIPAGHYTEACGMRRHFTLTLISKCRETGYSPDDCACIVLLTCDNMIKQARERTDEGEAA